MRSRPPSRRARWSFGPGRIALALAIAAVAIAALLVPLGHHAREGDEAGAATAATPQPRPAGAVAAPAAPPGGPPSAQARTRRRRQLMDNVQLADHTYCSYRRSTRYPFGARPIAEQPDQDRPNAPVADVQPMCLDGGGAELAVQIRTTQSRVYLASGEAAAFSLRAVDADGHALALVVTRALAQGMTYDGARASPQVAVPFADDGAGNGAGASTLTLAPGQTALAGFAGTIRTEVRYNVNGMAGAVLYDVVYTPELPAVWSGPPREAVEDGSLHFILPAEVRMPGRYVVSGRVDDATGRSLALLTFNDELGPGPNAVKLVLFGKLMHDQAAVMPLTLRDVDGYLLKDGATPDRALMPRLEGTVYTSRNTALDKFSDAEWQSEERTRYLAEYARDIARARTALAAFDPVQPPPASECVPATRP